MPDPDATLATEPVGPDAAADAAADLAARLDEERRRTLGYLRRALLAEHAGRVVPELVAGDSPEALEASLDLARAAFDAAREAARADLAREATASAAVPAMAPSVPPGTPARDAGAAEAPLSALERIARGLRRD